jgi:hypothetical protein
MIVGHDLTKMKENISLQEENKAVNLMSGYMSHEMLTPLKCVKQLATKISQN